MTDDPLHALARWGTLPALAVANSGGWQTLDYAGLAAAAAARAHWLARAGVGPGQTVLCPTRPALGLAITRHALGAIGAALLPVRADLDAAARAALIAVTGCEWVWSPNPDPMDTGALHATGLAPADPHPLDLLVQTSGSGGQPKVAMLTRRAVLASADRINARLDLRAGDRWLCCLPRQHIGGLAIGDRCALAGAGCRVLPDFDAVTVAGALRGEAITHCSLVPPMLARLLDLLPTPPPALRCALLGGQPLDPALARRATAGGWPLYLGYGMTETCSQVAGAWITGDGSGDWLAPLPDLAVADSADPGTAAPLRLRGPMLMAGYANPARRPGDGLVDGWLPTADLARRAPDGRLRIVGRADEVLVVGGVNVLPADCEARLALAPGIGELAVVGVPEPMFGHRLVACYTGTARPADLDAWARAHLDSPLRPRGWLPRPDLPRLPSGKYDRRALRALAMAGTAKRHGPAPN